MIERESHKLIVIAKAANSQKDAVASVFMLAIESSSEEIKVFPLFAEYFGKKEKPVEVVVVLFIALQISCFIIEDAIGCAKNVMNGVQNAQRTLDPIRPLTTAYDIA